MAGIVYIINLLIWFIVCCFHLYLSLKRGGLYVMNSFLLILIGFIGIVTPFNIFLWMDVSMLLQLISMVIMAYYTKKKSL